MFKWNKKGLLYETKEVGWTHASHPCIIHIKEDLFLIAFTKRDSSKKSNIFLVYAKVNQGIITLIDNPKLALTPGDYGYFDCDGVISGCLIKNYDQIYLYYVGWQNLPDTLWICDTGRAKLDLTPLTLEKEFLGPVIGRDREHPLFAAATAFFIDENNIWHTWFNSGLSWEKVDSNWKHKYGLHHGTSINGLDWKFDEGMAIPFADEYEYAFGRPTVVKWDDKYHMWYAHRETEYIKTYRIGYASSDDGLNWTREDAKSGIDVSEEGWDSEMICYPSVFSHSGLKYMLYNGNGYGETGFGYAVLEEANDE